MGAEITYAQLFTALYLFLLFPAFHVVMFALVRMRRKGLSNKLCVIRLIVSLITVGVVTWRVYIDGYPSHRWDGIYKEAFFRNYYLALLALIIVDSFIIRFR